MAVASHSWHSRWSHTTELVPVIRYLLHEASIDINALKGIALALGPGGFSSLRVGMSVSKGLCLTLSIPLVGISTLEIEAYPYANTERPICPLIDMRREDVAWAQFQKLGGEWRQIQNEKISALDELPHVLPMKAILCGEGITAHSSTLKSLLPFGISVVQYPGPDPRLHSLAELGHIRLEQGCAQDPVSLQPLYLRTPTITKPNPPTQIIP